MIFTRIRVRPFCIGILSLASVFPFAEMYPQPFIREVEGIPFHANGSPIQLPFVGGVNSPIHQFVDIDADGDNDLFVLDNDLVIEFYRNEGSATNHDFKPRSGLIQLPRFSAWFLFFDFDGDGLIDLVTDDTTFTGVRVHKNIGTPQAPQFIILIPTLRDENGINVFAGQNSIPAFIDIDADGDHDFFSGNFDGSVNFYRNVGSQFNPVYRFITPFWEGILIIGDTCYTSAPRAQAHGASAMRFADIDGDNDNDLFFGDFFAQGLFFLRNVGTPTVPDMMCETNRFPPGEPILTAGFNQVTLADIDGDGDLDMFSGVLAPLVQSDGFWFYRNIGTRTAFQFARVTKNFISSIDVGMNAHPAFVDIDADGDQDMIVGNLNGRLTLFRNDGTASSPSFTLVDSTYQSITGGFSHVPAFVDIDNDGDRDLFIGMFDGRMKFYRNVGSPQSAVFQLQPSPGDTINVGQTAAPAFVDIDGDGDPDLFVGKGNGRLNFYRNTGTPTVFQPVLESTFFQNIIAGQNSIPTFSDIDDDGDFDLFIGTSEGRIEFYRNDGSPALPQFIRITNHFANTAPTIDASPALVDIDGDGDKDLFMGNVKGGLHFYRNQLITSVATNLNRPVGFSLAQNYPNPFNPTTSFRFEVPSLKLVTLKVYDLIGREVATLVNEELKPGSYETTWDASDMASGVYFYRLTAGRFGETKKGILLR